MPDKIPQEGVEKLLNDEPLTLKEAKEIACDTLKINEKYYEEFVRPQLKPRPMLKKHIQGKGFKLGALKVLKSELEQVLARIKQEFKSI